MAAISTKDFQKQGNERLKAAKANLGISKAELCCRLGVRPCVYDGYLRGDAVPPLVMDRLESLLRNRGF